MKPHYTIDEIKQGATFTFKPGDKLPDEILNGAITDIHMWVYDLEHCYLIYVDDAENIIDTCETKPLKEVYFIEHNKNEDFTCGLFFGARETLRITHGQ